MIALVFLLTACGNSGRTWLGDAFGNPGKVAKKEMPKNAPPDYKKGWGDGCESGLASAYTNSWYKTFHKYRKDLRLLNNQMYVIGWDDGNRYCRHYAGQWVRWGYFDDLDGSLRDKNVPEQYTFAIPGWNGVKYDGNVGDFFGKDNQGFFGTQKSADTIFGWSADAGDIFVPAKSPFP